MTAPSRIAFTLVAACLAGCNWLRKPVGPDVDYLHYQDQFFYRMSNADVYLPEPALFDKLDLDDNVMYRHYEQDRPDFQRKLDAMHVDINTLLVKPDPNPIRILALEESSPEHLWRLFLLTGDDTAQLLKDGIHVRRRGFPEQILGGRHAREELQIHSEMGTPLWRPNPQGGWWLDKSGSGVVYAVGSHATRTEKKHKTVFLYHVDCDALHQFVQPLAPGESTRDMILKVNIPSTPEQLTCQINLDIEEARKFRRNR
jgi:hypothetical protein